MEAAMRASDAIKDVRSYIVIETFKEGLHVSGSYWAVGYTPAHCDTPLKAIDYAIEQAEQKMTEAQAKVVELYDMRTAERFSKLSESVDHGGSEDH